MNTENLLYVIPAGQYGKEGILALLEQHPEIKFVSLVGVDLAGNDTDEKIPISVFFDDYESFFDGSAFQTDGSSVVLPGIATLDNARVDIKADPGVNWFVDYNDGNIDEA
ncbi:MAG: glutamine synthetase, partial [Megasphaera micronuciformis]|nr:glutamine synthetase [Megasphaera micronuciformis]